MKSHDSGLTFVNRFVLLVITCFSIRQRLYKFVRIGVPGKAGIHPDKSRKP